MPSPLRDAVVPNTYVHLLYEHLQAQGRDAEALLGEAPPPSQGRFPVLRWRQQLRRAASALNDLYLPYASRKPTPERAVAISKRLTVVFGVIQIGIAIGAQYLVQSVVNDALAIAGFAAGTRKRAPLPCKIDEINAYPSSKG